MSEPGRTTIAAFDFDGTLTDRDSVVPFVRSLVGTARLAIGFASRPLELVPAVARRDRDRIKSIASAAAFAGRPIAATEEAARRYGAMLVDERLRADTLARLRWHQQRGHVTVIVSASYELYLREVVRALGIDGLAGTRLEIDGDVFTGRLDGANCRGAEKVHRLERWMVERGLEPPRCVIYAYGDSAGDRELLAAAHHPHLVNEPLDSVAPAV